jgi:hypothetical protein
MSVRRVDSGASNQRRRQLRLDLLALRAHEIQLVMHPPEPNQRRDDEQRGGRAGNHPRGSPRSGALEGDCALGSQRRSDFASCELCRQHIGTLGGRGELAVRASDRDPMTTQRNRQVSPRLRSPGNADARRWSNRIRDHRRVGRSRSEASNSGKSAVLELQQIRAIVVRDERVRILTRERGPDRKRRIPPCALGRRYAFYRPSRLLGSRSDRRDESRRR